jgi:ABC-type multidrug transport system ATPase subunit
MVALLAARRDSGKTIFVVTHQPALLEGVADESVFMSNGTIVAREQGVPDTALAIARTVPR